MGTDYKKDALVTPRKISQQLLVNWPRESSTYNCSSIFGTYILQSFTLIG